MKKILSMILAIAMVLSLTVTALAADTNEKFQYADSIIYADVVDGELTSYSQDSIIVLTEKQAVELGAKLKAIAMNCELVYITGATDPQLIAEIAELPAPGRAISINPENTQTIAVAIDNIDGSIFIKEITVISDNLESLMAEAGQSGSTIMSDGIKTALYEAKEIKYSTGPISAVSFPDPASPNAFPSNRDKYYQQSASIYDKNNNVVGSMYYTANYYNRGYFNGGYMFDTILEATFEPDSSHYLKQGAVTLGHTYDGGVSHTILDQSNIASSTTDTTYQPHLGNGSDLGLYVSWTYNSVAMDIENDFSLSNRKIWYIDPVSTAAGTTVVLGSGIRSISSTSSGRYTTVTMSCPIYSLFGLLVTGSNDMGMHINW